MRHATVYALEVIQGVKREPGPREAGWEFGAGNRRACDWESSGHEEAFERFDAAELLDGMQVALPTCPACCALLDLAFELRGS